MKLLISIITIVLFYISAPASCMDFHPKDKKPNPLSYSITLQSIKNTSCELYLLLQSNTDSLGEIESKQNIMSKIDKEEIIAIELKPKTETAINKNLS
ncbi:MAG TPA: hypothetical protein VHO47_03270 [Candidatus Babeliales bacterium]|nr:hypothetical protein [Candidatus Babeliales bacterium]